MLQRYRKNPSLVKVARPTLMDVFPAWRGLRSEEHTSEFQSLMRISYAVFCLKKTNRNSDDIMQLMHKSNKKKQTDDNACRHITTAYHTTRTRDQIENTKVHTR